MQKQTVTHLFRLLHKYRPETHKQKHIRLLRQAQTVVEGQKQTVFKKPSTLKFGVNHVTSLIEEKKTKLVLIAHDVNPIELIVWLPALCRKMNVPYCIIKGKSRLGKYYIAYIYTLRQYLYSAQLQYKKVFYYVS